MIKSREELLLIAEELGLKIKFDSENPGVTYLNEDDSVNNHHSYDEIKKLFKNNLDIDLY